jgi:hypothetical protein
MESSQWYWVYILGALLMAGAMHTFFRYVVVPSQVAQASVKNEPRGNLSDLYPQWLAARELLLRGRDPYASDVTAEIQQGYWGRQINKNNPNDPKDEARFAYPLFVVFLLAPIITLPFQTAQIVYLWIVSLLSIASVWFWLHALGHRRSWAVRILSATLLLGSYPFVMGFYVQNLSLLVAALIGGVAAAVASGHLWLAGLLLAITTIKPQWSVALAAWLLLWAVSKWSERKALFISFSGTMLLLWAGSQFLLPGWIDKWLKGTSEYLRYAPRPPAHIEFLLGKYLGSVITIALVLFVAALCWRIRFDSADTDRFKLLLAAIPLVNLVTSPVWHSYDGLFLLPSALLIFHWHEQFQRLRPLEGAIVILTVAALLWQWLAASSISLAALVWPEGAARWQILPWLPVLFGPTLTLVSLALIARVRLVKFL